MITVPMTLRHTATGKPVKAGDTVRSFRDEIAVVATDVGRSPHKSSSTGRIFVLVGNGKDVATQSSFPSVYGCAWHYDNPEAAETMGLYVRADNIGVV